MDYIGVIRELKEMLLRQAEQLDRWAAESKSGGWSTHQVEPMQKKASDIRMKLIQLGLLQ